MFFNQVYLHPGRESFLARIRALVDLASEESPGALSPFVAVFFRAQRGIQRQMLWACGTGSGQCQPI